jgi:hypothetical protein
VDFYAKKLPKSFPKKASKFPQKKLRKSFYPKNSKALLKTTLKF